MAAAPIRPTLGAMTTEISTGNAHPHAASRGRKAWHFTRHYLEMVVSMFAGMFVLGYAEQVAFPDVALGVEAGVLVMATNMAIGMGAWMRIRGHSWRGIAEMSASMYLPFAVLLVPYWTGAIDAHALMSWGHILMFPAMALVMVLRPHEYTHH
jgi:hypothetical protein